MALSGNKHPWFKHGMTGTRLHRIWKDMNRRCYSTHRKQYTEWGGRGIRVCDAWRDSFTPFMEWALATGYTDELQIDRIDNDGHYEPRNCRWVTQRKNCSNTRRNNNMVGVSWNQSAGMYVAQIYVKGKAYHLGTSRNPINCRIAYKFALRLLT